MAFTTTDYKSKSEIQTKLERRLENAKEAVDQLALEAANNPDELSYAIKLRAARGRLRDLENELRSWANVGTSWN